MRSAVVRLGRRITNRGTVAIALTGLVTGLLAVGCGSGGIGGQSTTASQADASGPPPSAS